MDKAFHYYCIRVLAEKAGFSPEHAQTIAYASQYADDATEHKPIKIENVPSNVDYPRYDGLKFDPVCTAHSAKTWYKKVWKWAKFYLKPKVQRQILMVFHFLPPFAFQDGNNQNGFHFVTRENSSLANRILDNAIAHFKESKDNTNLYEFSLVKIGLALHTFSDTWAHSGFSGRHNTLENDIKNMMIKKGANFSSVSVLENITSYAAPDVGHSEASTIPDKLGNHWKAFYADSRKRPKEINRNNASKFLAASKEIYDKLSKVAQNRRKPWNKLSSKLEPVLKKQDTWKSAFPEISFSYSLFDWREEALSGDSVDWDDYDDKKDFEKLNLKWTGNDLKWFWFHKAANEQRTFLADKIPDTWSNM